MSIRTIKNNIETTQEIKKSEFIASAARVSTPEDAQEFIDSIKQKYAKATHHCWAYIVGEQSNFQKMSDDGEPSGTAGVPIIEVIKKNELTDIVIVVTRFFGGIKLGSGGLIRAYGSSASSTLKEAGIVEIRNLDIISFHVAYNKFDQIQFLLNQENIQLIDQQFANDIIVKIALAPEKIIELTPKIEAIINTELDYHHEGTQPIEIDIQKDDSH